MNPIFGFREENMPFYLSPVQKPIKVQKYLELLNEWWIACASLDRSAK